MQRNPLLILFGVSVMLYLGAQNWRRRKLKRAVRDLPTRMQRLLGGAPTFDPPDQIPEGLAPYAALHQRTRRIELGVRVIAGLWLIYVLYLVLEGMPQ